MRPLWGLNLVGSPHWGPAFDVLTLITLCRAVSTPPTERHTPGPFPQGLVTPQIGILHLVM